MTLLPAEGEHTSDDDRGIIATGVEPIPFETNGRVSCPTGIVPIDESPSAASRWCVIQRPGQRGSCIIVDDL